jgi:cysteine desulfuration protein SufE
MIDDAIKADIQTIIDDFDLLGDWDERYQYLVEIGEQMPPMPPADKSVDNWVRECMSTVHVAAHPDGGSPPRLHYSGDCDTAIIKGVVAILVKLYSGKTAAQIEQTDVEALFAGLKLEEHLSPNRHVGVYAIDNKMRQQARALA